MQFALITYDIGSDRRRAEVSALLSEFGPRVQLSVFEVEFASHRVRASLLARLADLIDDAEDQVRIYDLHSISARRTVLGGRTLEERVPYLIV